MPVIKTTNGKWKVQGTTTEHETKEEAEEQQRAIYAAKRRTENK